MDKIFENMNKYIIDWFLENQNVSVVLKAHEIRRPPPDSQYVVTKLLSKFVVGFFAIEPNVNSMDNGP